MLQGQQYLLYRAFAFWHSRTTSLPAIRFHANNLKASAWKKWMAAMPRALQAKKAREVHKQNLLCMFAFLSHPCNVLIFPQRNSSRSGRRSAKRSVL